MRDLAAEALRHQLEAVAHAEDRDAGGEDARVDRRRALGSYTDEGPPDSTIAFGLLGQHLRDRHGVRHDLGVDAGLAHPSGDELGVLRPEVDHQDQVVLHVAHSRTFRREAASLSAGHGATTPRPVVRRVRTPTSAGCSRARAPD